MPQKYEQFTPQLLPRYWRSPKMRFMNVNGDAYLCFLDFTARRLWKPPKQEAMVLVWLCLFITHTHTHKAQKYKVYPHLLDREQTPPLHDTTATQIHMQRTRRKKKSDIVVLVFFLEHHEFCFWPRGLSRGLSPRRSGFVSQLPLFGLVRQLQVQVQATKIQRSWVLCCAYCVLDCWAIKSVQHKIR